MLLILYFVQKFSQSLIYVQGIGKLLKSIFGEDTGWDREINKAAYADHTMPFNTDQEISTKTLIFCLENPVYFLTLLKPFVI